VVVSDLEIFLHILEPEKTLGICQVQEMNWRSFSLKCFSVAYHFGEQPVVDLRFAFFRLLLYLTDLKNRW
jgi:hypothetical protein